MFNKPMEIIKEVKKIKMDEKKQKKFNSKSILCAWITKLCPAQCESCFFKSNMYKDTNIKEKYELSNLGVEKLIKFVNDSNNSYLMLSGGGEPMIRPDVINKIIKRVKTDRIVIVTSGIWAKDYNHARKEIGKLYKSLIGRNDNMKLILRLSVDSFHCKSLGYKNIYNIFDIFRKEYSDKENFELRVHTMREDSTIEYVASNIDGCSVVYNDIECVSDNSKVIKILPKQAFIEFTEGYKIKVGISKLFFSDLKIDLNLKKEEIQQNLDVFEEDMSLSEYGNPSIITNCDGSLGLDFWVDYNGNVTTWGNQQWDSLYNLYTDDYKDLIKGTFGNLISYSFLDKGYYYRERIIKKVNPLAVIRSKAMNLRDYAGAFLMEEDKTKAYYAIITVKDYLEEGVLIESDLENVSDWFKEILKLPVNKLINLYKQSKYDILSQYIEKANELTQEDFDIIFILINLGHYDVNSVNIERAIKLYNKLYNTNISKISEIKDREDILFYGKFHNRISFMKKEAENFVESKYLNLNGFKVK